MFCLLVVLVKFQYLPNDWLESLPWGNLAMARGSSPKSQAEECVRFSWFILLFAPCRLQCCKNWPTPFTGRMSYKAAKPGLVSVLYLSMCSTVLLFIRAPFYVLLVFVAMCSVFWLFWLNCQYLPSDWLERLLWGSLTVARPRGSSPESPGWRVCMIFLVNCIASLFYYVFFLSPAPTWHIFLLLWRDIAYLCWKCR